LQVGACPSKASNNEGFKFSLITKSGNKTRDSQKLDTKVLSEDSVKYWTASSGLHKIRRLWTEKGIAALLY
jgi:hypothetical protein